MFSPPTKAQWAAIELLAIDVDGTLTDGSLTFDENGALSQTFHVRDGFAMVAARQAGLKIAWISGRSSRVAQHRFAELKLHFCHFACSDKSVVLRKLQEQHGWSVGQCCFVGDDLPDLQGFAVCGLNVAVGDAVPEVKERAHYITAATGGRGAVREVIELILKSRGDWEPLVSEMETTDPCAIRENLQR